MRNSGFNFKKRIGWTIQFNYTNINSVPVTRHAKMSKTWAPVPRRSNPGRDIDPLVNNYNAV